MKKLVVLGTAVLALNAVASEVQVKAGYDFNRKVQVGDTTTNEDSKLKKGPVVGVEYIFDNQGEFEWGVGAEYKLSNNSGSLRSQTIENNKNEKKVRVAKNAPVYALGKFNVITTKSGNDALYVLGRVGYGFVSNAKETEGVNIKGGLYTGIGIGTEYGPVSLEALYERQNATVKSGDDRQRDAINTFGVRLGYRFGNLVNDRAPKIVTNTVVKEVIKEVPVVREVIKEVPAAVAPVVNNGPVGTTIKFDGGRCVEEGKCVIRGFKVDGKEPNAAEAKDLQDIANYINSRVDSATVNFVGHTDSTGSDAYNQKLSVERANNVAKLLKQYGLKDSIKIGTKTGKGETQPADSNATVEGKYNNRRVELFFTK